MADLSVVTMTWNRSGQRVSNLLLSLLEQQKRPPAEVIVVDTSDDEQRVGDIAERCRSFPAARYIRRPCDTLRKSWALNVGIQASSPFSRWIATVDIDMMFGPGAMLAVAEILSRKRCFVTVEPMRLPEGWTASLDYDALCMQATWWGPSGGPGALQATERGTWYAMRGYDERFDGGLGGMDVDMMERAMTGFGQVYTVPFRVCKALHQWHPPSPLKGARNHLLQHDAPVTANSAGWGDL